MISDLLTITKMRSRGVIKKSERGVHKSEQHKLVALLDRVNWDDLHFLRNVGGARSLRGAALSLGISVNTVRARISRLEEMLETILFVRDRDGLRLTPQGKQTLSVANEMYFASQSLSFGEGNNSLVKEGELRLCITEGIGTFWIVPKLTGLKALLPDVAVSLDSTADQTMLDPKMHDISIGFTRPSDKEAIVAKLATVHVMAFASTGYVEKFGAPRSLDELVDHHCVQQDAPGLNYDAIRLLFSEEMISRFVRYKVSSSYSLLWAVANDVGIGALPTYIAGIYDGLRPLDLPVQFKFDLWMSYSQSARHSLPIRTAVEWLRSCFNPQLYPWFDSQFIHPNHFPDFLADHQIISMFDDPIDGRG